jgi:Cytochrome c554 and c-prime
MKNIFLIALTFVAGSTFASVESHYDGGRVLPVHRISLNDEFGDLIVPGGQNVLPVSTRQTCGQCHDYDTIACGWHFNMSKTNAVAGRPAQPWFLIDSVSGSQIPMGLRDWPGLYKPSEIGMSNWQWTHTFGRNMPGGDVGDPADIYAEGGPHARWEVSGPMEINCFACHSTDKAYDHSEWARLVTRQNFRWAASGALGLGEVLGMGERVGDYWGIMRGLNKDDSIYAVPPHIVYDNSKFDAKSRTILELGKPRNENCLNCHSTTQAGMSSKDIDGDVHLRAGMTCTDCHANGLNHEIARGYLGDNTGKMDKTRATASCAGCHLGGKGAETGRFGAPMPKHVGIPVVHFDKLSCTTCHSGVTEKGELAQVRTSRANRMGIYGRARWVTPQPFIMEPVFVRNADGKIEPRRMVWPAYWATRKGAKITPITPEQVMESAKGELAVREQVGSVLEALATDPNIPGIPVIVMNGQAYKRNADGLIVPDVKTSVADGFWYKTETTTFVRAVVDFDPDADISKLKEVAVLAAETSYKANNKSVDEAALQKVKQAAGEAVDQDFKAKKTVLENLLQTLDASPLAKGNGSGALVLKGKIYYRETLSNNLEVVSCSLPVDQVAIGWLKDGAFQTILTDYVIKNAIELAGTDYSLNEEMIATGLKTLKTALNTDTVYVAHGQVWSLTANGTLEAKEEKIAEPVSWSFGHDVRGARMARGSKPAKCADCHTTDSTFFFANVESTGPLMTMKKMVKPQIAYMGLSSSYNKLFGSTFLMRPLFKIFLWVVFAFVVMVTIAFISVAVPAVLKREEDYRARHTKFQDLLALAEKGAVWGIILASAYLTLSGLLGWFFHLMTGYVLVFHMVAGGLFATCLLVLIWFRGSKRITNPKRHTIWMIMLIFGILVVFTAVAPMMTWFGTDWQWVMLKMHRCVTFAFLAIATWMLITGGRKE